MNLRNGIEFLAVPHFYRFMSDRLFDDLEMIFSP